MISASILSIKENLKNNVEILDKTNIDLIHLDVMDGIFVQNKTWSIEEIKPILRKTTKPLDIHLMVQDVEKYVNEFKILNPTYITFHYEIQQDIMNLIKYIKSLNIKVGISIKPHTRVEQIIKYLDYIDLVLVMTVEPGMGGQEFIIDTIDKVKQLNDLKDKYNFKIEVDGGINDTTIKKVEADIYVVGSYITRDNNYEEKIQNLKKI